MPPRDPRANDRGSPGDASPPERKSWRGNTASSQTIARHRWQRDWTKEQDIEVQRRNLRHRLKVLLLCGLFLGLTLAFAYYLFYPARKSPFVPIAVTKYDFPIPPNSFAREDVEQFKDLHDESLVVVDGTGIEETDWNQSWRNVPDGINRLSKLLGKTVGLARQQTLVIYLSMHGVVDLDERNQPRACLLPPSGGSNKEWLPVADLFALLKKEEFARRKKLLILDAHRLESDWSLGQLYNGFGAALEDAFQAAQVPNLVVLTAAAPGQVAWASPEMARSNFGHFVSLGLHGQADGFGPGGSADSDITLAELEDFVRTQSDAWASENRVDRQTPLLLAGNPAEARQWIVAQTPSRGLLAWLANWFGASTSAAPTAEATTLPDAASDELADLWQEHRDLEEASAVSRDPIGWELFERRLIWGDQLAEAGQDGDYGNARNSNLAELKRLIAQLRPAEVEYPASTIPLAELLGGPSAGLAPARNAWKKQQSGVERNALLATLDQLEQDSPAAHDFAEVQFLRLLSSYLPADDWSTPDLVTNVVRLRDLAEQVAAPADLRVSPWIAPAVSAADDKRRLAEDKLFIGAKGQDKGPQNDVLRADDLYKRAQKLGNVMTAAYKLRDDIAAKGPYLAAWLSRRMPAALEEAKLETYTQKLDDLLKSDFFPLLERYRSFSLEGLERPDEDLADVTALDRRTQLLSDEIATIRAHFNKLQDAFNSECQELKVLAGDSGKNDTDKLRRIAAVLSVPLVDAQDRASLRANYKLISETRNHAWKEKDKSATAPRPEGTKREDLQLTRLKKWDDVSHPAIAVLRAALPADKDAVWETAGSDRLSDLARQGALLRQRLGLGLQGVSNFAAAAQADGIAKFRQNAELQKNSTARAGFGQADHMLRTVAALGPALDAQRKDPHLPLQAFDRCFLFRWQARRAMDDFYGSPAPEEDYFLRASTKYLAAAAQAMKVFCGSDAPNLGELALLEERRVAAGEIARFPQAEELAPGDGDIEHQLLVVPQPGLPAGEMAVYLEREGVETSRLQLIRPEANGFDSTDYRPAVPTAANPATSDGSYELNYSIRQPEPGKNSLRGARVRAVAYLRGHLSEEPLLSDPLLVEFRPPPYVPPTVLVNRSRFKTGELMFVFDCSGSMSEPTADGQRFDIARKVLLGVDEKGGVLDRLAGTGLYRVGLRIYGHRVGWVPQDPNDTRPPQVRRNPAILELHPQDVNHDLYRQKLARIRPGNDVDRLLPIGNFTQTELNEIRKLFFNASFKPWGITPLYYSIAQALEQDFLGGGAAAERRIVVLTDGNDQQNQDRDLPPADRMDAATLSARFKEYRQQHPGQEVKLDIVGFHVEEAPVLRGIARETGGEFHRASNPQELLNSLEQSLGLSNYVVVPGSGKEIGPGDFGKPLPIDPPPRKKTPYTVRVNKSTSETGVELEGGEAIELTLTDVGKLEHKRYRHEIRQTVENLLNPDQAGPREIFLGSHQPPARVGEERRFLISVQNQDETKFSPRPAEVWAEITPVFKSSTQPAPTYTFFDAYFEPQRPVPVLGFEVPRWPSEAAEAEVTLWCKYTRTLPDHEVYVADVANQPGLSLDKRSIPGLPEVTFDVKVGAVGDPVDEVSEVVVTVKQSGTGRDPVKVTMNPPPVAVQHQYFDSNRSVRHRFRFEGVPRAQLLDKLARTYSIEFTSAERLKEGAITPPEPFRVVIPD
ncbi:MAG: hypothetical protein KF708_07350 [Pirellulales bacterium]|nr:hypothetical protein [Pirellulales bacterium]